MVGGRIRTQGPAEEVVDLYRTAMHDETRVRTPAADRDEAPVSGLELGRNRFGSQEASIADVRLLGPAELEVEEIAVGDGLAVTLSVTPSAHALDHPIVGVTVTRVADELTVYDTSTDGEGLDLGVVLDGVELRLGFDDLGLLPGEYWVDVGVYPADWEYAYDYHWRAYSFRVSGSSHDNGVFRPAHRWQVAG
jgi:lipopolysaccharide transport system ATP-binding protein